jgi:hypothetical protein
MINLEKTFKKILQNWGYDVYIQRIIANGNYKETLERVTTRSVFPGGVINSRSSNEDEEGINVTSDITYYFESAINPKEGDRIYENLPNDFEKQTIYVIDTCSPMRGKGGKITYWIAGASREKQV